MLPYPDISPVALKLGPITLRWYGLMYVFGFTAGWLLGRHRAKQPWRNWTTRQVDDLITWSVLGLVLGARMGYVLFYDFAYFLENPFYILAIWKGGMSFHGGALGLIVVGYLFSRSTGKGFLEIGDFLTPLAPPGLFFGRIGNFINGELWGRPTDLPWGMVFPGAPGYVPRHPSQLYEAFLEGIVFFILLWAYSAKPRPRGAVLGMFFLLYGVFRFAVEFARQPDPQLGFIAFGWLTMGQILSAPMILAGAALIAWAYHRDNRSES